MIQATAKSVGPRDLIMSRKAYWILFSTIIIMVVVVSGLTEWNMSHSWHNTVISSARGLLYAILGFAVGRLLRIADGSDR